MEIGQQIKAIVEVPEYVYYIIGLTLVTHFGTILAFGKMLFNWAVDYKVQQRDIKDLRENVSMTMAELAKAKLDLNEAHNKIRDLQGVRR